MWTKQSDLRSASSSGIPSRHEGLWEEIQAAAGIPSGTSGSFYHRQVSSNSIRRQLRRKCSSHISPPDIDKCLGWKDKKRIILCLYLQNIPLSFVLDKPLLIPSRAQGNGKETQPEILSSVLIFFPFHIGQRFDHGLCYIFS